MSALAATWVIAALATGGVILRPWRLPEAVWAVTGAALLVFAGLLSPADAWRGVARGSDVYLFLIGMMLLAETARGEGLFEWMASHAANLARGSAARLFDLVYLVGTVVTIFMSNDATAVVLTPAVAAVARAARAPTPLPFLLVCAFVANAASFLLPISNPANLVIYGDNMPPLSVWLPRYLAPSSLAIVATYAVLRVTQREALRQPIARRVDAPPLSRRGRVTGAGIVLTAAALMAASALGCKLGPPTFAGGLATALVVVAMRPRALGTMLRDLNWGIIPLVAGLFVLVEALDRTGVIRLLADASRVVAHRSAPEAAWLVGVGVALISNAMNNLPVGLIVGTAVHAAGTPPLLASAALIGIDLGPNLSVTGSLATILWLAMLRREGLHIGAWTFLRLGLLVMPPSLLLALGALTATDALFPGP